MKNRKISLVLLVFILACSDERKVVPEVEQQDPVAKAEIDELIISSLKESDAFHWSEVSDEVIWSALIHSDSTLTIGYQPVGETNVNSRVSEINVTSALWLEASGPLSMKRFGYRNSRVLRWAWKA
ncbi:MAG: hypothetical protein AAGA66_02580 [Bacteroidota bacterium]